jgi:hypothetical protein
MMTRTLVPLSLSLHSCKDEINELLDIQWAGRPEKECVTFLHERFCSYVYTRIVFSRSTFFSNNAGPERTKYFFKAYI